MLNFFRIRGVALAGVIAVLAFVALLQADVLLTITAGQLRDPLHNRDVLSVSAAILRLALAALLVCLWLLNRRAVLYRCIQLTNGLLLICLLVETGALVLAVSGATAHDAGELLADAVRVAIMNILIFSIWYWMIDPPGVDREFATARPWHFLFPQRAGAVPHYEGWMPGYVDYLYLAFTATFTFGPTDVMPLTARAKLLMLLQAVISVITLTGIAGSAIGIIS